MHNKSKVTLSTFVLQIQNTYIFIAREMTMIENYMLHFATYVLIKTAKLYKLHQFTQQKSSNAVYKWVFSFGKIQLKSFFTMPTEIKSTSGFVLTVKL